MGVIERQLEPRIAEFQMGVSNRLLHGGIEIEWLTNSVVDTAWMRVRRTVWGEKLGEKTLTFYEQPVYDSPRHAFLATLPEHSFRRRFFAYLWGIDPNFQPKRKVHEVKVERWVNLPEVEFPEGYGPRVFQQLVTEMEGWS